MWKLSLFQLSLFCKNYRFSKTALYIINRKIHGCLEIPDLLLVLNMIMFMFNTRNKWSYHVHIMIISCSTIELNLVFRAPMYYSLFIPQIQIVRLKNNICTTWQCDFFSVFHSNLWFRNADRSTMGYYSIPRHAWRVDTTLWNNMAFASCCFLLLSVISYGRYIDLFRTEIYQDVSYLTYFKEKTSKTQVHIRN
jgi:hypothetical protein